MTVYIDRFKGRTAVITGGASGVGLHCARRITGEGGRVALWDRDRDALAQASAELGDCSTFTVDVTSWPQLEQAALESFAALGRIDILIAGAGITGPNSPLADYPVSEWANVININLIGV